MTRKQKETPITTLPQALGTERIPFSIESAAGGFKIHLRPITVFEADDLKNIEEELQDLDTKRFLAIMTDLCIARGDGNLSEEFVRKVLKMHADPMGLFNVLITGVPPQEGEDPKNVVKPTGA